MNAPQGTPACAIGLPKVISPTDAVARYTAAANSAAVCAYVRPKVDSGRLGTPIVRVIRHPYGEAEGGPAAWRPGAMTEARRRGRGSH
jgi:hypothetical protein